MMVNIVTILAGVYCTCSLVRAMIVTKYKITPAPVSSDVLACGESAGSIDYCAARVTNDTCEPLTRDWCKTKDMSMDGSYLIKQTIKHVPEVTYMRSFSQPVPINMTIGSEVEMKFVVRSGWNGCDLEDASNNVVIQTMVQSSRIYSSWRLQGAGWLDSTIVNSLNHFPDTEYTLTIRCNVSGFQIYLDGDYILTFTLSTLPANTITDIFIFFKRVDGDLLSVSYKSGM